MKIPSFLKSTRNKVLTGIGLLVIVSLPFFFGKDELSARTVEAQLDNLEQMISATGRVTSAQDIDLAFDNSGKINRIYVNVGQKVLQGQILIKLAMDDLTAQWQRESANLKIAETRLNQLLAGSRTEDIEVLRTNVAGARESLKTTREKNAVDTAAIALNTAINALVTISDAQGRNTAMDQGQSRYVYELREIALEKIYGQPNLGKTVSWYFLRLNGGLKKEIEDLKINPDSAPADKILEQTKNVLMLVEQALNAMLAGLDSSLVLEADKISISSAKTNVLNQISAISVQQQSIISADNSLKSLESQLALKIASPTDFDTQIAEAQLEQARAGLALVQSQIEKKMIRSPINGTVTSLYGKIGEMISPNRVLASVIGTSKSQIEVNVPEVDVAKISVGNEAMVTLDAYGPDIVWPARVIQIYPAEKMVEGVPTYKTVVEFEKEDQRIKLGMTANLEIKNQTRENVLVMPQRAIIRKDGKKYARLLVDEKDFDNIRFANAQVLSTQEKAKYVEVEIETGLQGSNGKVEIISGLRAGDKILSE